MPLSLRPLALALLAAIASLPAGAQAIRLQVIHNAADPAAAVVDVYVNGALTLDDFAFRAATPFLTLPSNTDLTVAIAPGTSAGAGDALFTQTFNLPSGAYQLIASGVLTSTNFAPNPDGQSIAFQLVPALNVREVAADPTAVDLRVIHGATDAPTVNVRSEGVTIVGDITYPEVSASYWPLAPGVYPLDVTLPNGGPVVASFTADLSGAAGAAITVLASGFLTPAANQNGEAFGLLAVFADGTTALLPAAEAKARLQVIHNAADPAAAVVDVYVNGDRLLDDFAFRAATPFIDVPADVPLSVAIAPGSSTSVADALFTESFTLPENSTTQLVANGVLAPASFAANPDGRATAFQLLVGGNAQESAASGSVGVRVVHGATDAPTVDVRSSGVVLVDDAAYTDVTGYLALPPAAYTLDVTLADGTPVASFAADLAGAGGAAVTVLASGFLTPAANQNGEAFGLLAVFADGTTALLPSAAVRADEAPEMGTLRLGAPSPNPLTAAGTVAFSLDAPGRAALTLYDALGRRVATLADGTFAADRHEAAVSTQGLAAGVYVLRLETATGARARTLTVAR